MQIKDGWTRRFKGDRQRGGAYVYLHPDSFDGRAIVENHHGIKFNGEWYPSLVEAKSAALSHLQTGVSK